MAYENIVDMMEVPLLDAYLSVSGAGFLTSDLLGCLG